MLERMGSESDETGEKSGESQLYNIQNRSRDDATAVDSEERISSDGSDVPSHDARAMRQRNGVPPSLWMRGDSVDVRRWSGGERKTVKEGDIAPA